MNELDKIFGSESLNTKPIDLSAFDKNSADGLEAKRQKKIRESEADPLIDSLKEAIHVSEDTKERLIHLAELYLGDMKANMLKDQFDLSDEYDGTTADEWATFLADRVVSTYINKHKNAMLRAKAELNLADPYAKNKRDNLNLLKTLNEKDQEDKQQIVIIRIPDKYGDDDE